jgi:anti-sigma regulatory factor (Ser/Thr protein kinase)
MPPQTVDVRHETSVGKARRAAATMAAAIGFVPQACDEITLATTELATNLIKHAGGGILTFTTLAKDGRVGLQIQSCDTGRGIDDIEQAIGDRYSTSGSRGTGLGAVNRLMDEFDIASKRGRGTDIVCRKWRREYAPSIKSCPLGFGVATRPRTFGQVNGDTFVVYQWSESALVGVIDGLGHGQFAHRAAETARQYVESHFDLPLDQIIRGTCRACRATRGVVMALARFDWGLGTMSFASVGNILVRVFPRSEPFHFVVRRGVIGLNAPKAIVTEHAWPLDHVLVLHSDGVSSHWSWQDLPGWEDRSADSMAQDLLHSAAKGDDDATVIVVRNVIR